MTDPHRTCPGCGAPAPEGIKFCGECGAAVAAIAAPAVATAPIAVAQVAEPVAPSAQAPEPAAHKKTILGMSAPELAAAPPPQSTPSSRPPAPGRHQHTMFGMPQPEVASPAPKSDPPGAPTRADILGPSQRTMLGMAAPGLAPPAAARPASSSVPPPRDAGPSAAAPVAPPRQRSEVAFGVPATPPAPGTASSSDYALPTRGPSKRSLLVVAGVIGVLAIFAALVAIAIALLRGGGASDVRASVVQTDHGDALRVEIAGAPAGARIRYAGQERPLEAGAALLPIPTGALRIGDNVVPLQIVAGDGEVEELEVALSLELRVRADLEGLRRDPPSVAIVVDTVPGAAVTLDGETLRLDARGHGEKRYPLDSAAEGSAAGAAFEHRVRYRITPPGGAPAEGEVRTRIPYATLQIDRPGTSLVTDASSVEIAGAVAQGATVTIDGARVAVADGRFVHRFPLPANGAFAPVVVARQPGRAPRAQRIRIRRVPDLAAEARNYEVTPDLTFARIQQNPNIYRGQRIALEGRVYNVQVSGGRSVLQMLVRDCPRGQHCPLWVTYPAATDVEVDRWVRVVGEIGGEQQFRADSGQVRTVPRVDAVFVIPLDS